MSSLKYAGLEGIDEGNELFESTVPDLTEGSTLPTQSESDDISDDGNLNFERRALDPDAARSRFEPSVVDARNANFSDTIDGGRRDYQIHNRRRRRRAVLVGRAENDSDESEGETLQGRLARLRRETAELQGEIEKIKAEKKQEKDRDEDSDTDYEDTVDHPDQAQYQEDLSRGAEELSRTLEGMSVSTYRKKGLTLEEEFMQRLDDKSTSKPVPQSKPSTSHPQSLSQSSISAIAAFSDRLTDLETTLGVSPITQALSSSSSTPILPTIDLLNTQIETLYSILSPRAEPFTNQTQRAPTTVTSTAHLDPLAEKIRQLISESQKLEESRRAATKSFEELLETRDRHAHILNNTHTHTHTFVHPNTEARLQRTTSAQNATGATNNTQQDSLTTPTPTSPGPHSKPSDLNSTFFTPLFLTSQSNRITALHALLSTIQSLQPLLPIVLERLRALNVLHAGAADVKGEMEEFERRLRGQEEAVAEWRGAVERVEGMVRDGMGVMRENVGVLMAAVNGVEERVEKLGPRERAR